MQLCTAVKKRIVESAKKHGVKRAPFVSCRVTQVRLPLFLFASVIAVVDLLFAVRR